MHVEDSFIFTHVRTKALMSFSLQEVIFWWAPLMGGWGNQHGGKHITLHQWEWVTDFIRNPIFLCPSFQRLKTQSYILWTDKLVKTWNITETYFLWAPENNATSFNTEYIAGTRVKAVQVFAECPIFFLWLQKATYFRKIQHVASGVNFLIILFCILKSQHI